MAEKIATTGLAGGTYPCLWPPLSEMNRRLLRLRGVSQEMALGTSEWGLVVDRNIPSSEAAATITDVVEAATPSFEYYQLLK